MPRRHPSNGENARPSAHPGLVVLSAGWAGDRVLVRLLSARGGVRFVGHALADPVPDPAAHLRAALRRGDERVGAAVVLPHHLWLRNGLDASPFVADLVAEGTLVLTLSRRMSDDRGLSLALCGPTTEVLPSAPRQVDAGEVALYSQENDFAREWFAELGLRAEHHIVFEDDLAGAADRERTLARIAALLDLPSGPAPPDAEVPDHATLWALAANEGSLRAGLAQLRQAVGG